ncbi:MAG: hypothetical protein J5542_05440 [Bacteroidales bacterium]|nr:hypothetical protein [Bacteroidales bacterium]
MKRLKDTNTHLSFDIRNETFEFEIFSLGDYSFDENLDFDEKSGIYMFLRQEQPILSFNEFSSNVKCEKYKPLYLGRTENFNQRFCGHHKEKKLLIRDVTHIALYFCRKNSVERIEALFLNTYCFELNILSNTREDLVVLSARRALLGKSKNL